MVPCIRRASAISKMNFHKCAGTQRKGSFFLYITFLLICYVNQTQGCMFTLPSLCMQRNWVS
uniref:Uncharacterized protein n=1 Tax=Anguilla anguilla TaxID=7936 RepID=A0A0E9PK14_ANGAN